jgi:hypothetical protein
MSLRVIGAGWPRTGTTSLKVALERLLTVRCYHMYDLFVDIRNIEIWERALTGDMSGVLEALAAYGAVVDWPASFFWPELLAANPDALVLLSSRDTQSWWYSMSATIVAASYDDRELYGDQGRYRPMITEVFRRATGAQDWSDPQQVMTAYERYNDEVRARAPAGKLIDWMPEDGYGPICAALGVPEPSTPFPCVNTTEQFNENWARVTHELSASPTASPSPSPTASPTASPNIRRSRAGPTRLATSAGGVEASGSARTT